MQSAVLRNRNLLSVICAYTSFRDLYAFDQVYPENGLLTRFGDRAIIAEVNTRLGKIFGDTLPEFREILRDTGSVISGSFMLQCVLGEHWKDSDVDVYVGTDVINREITAIDDFLNEQHQYEWDYFTMKPYARALHNITGVRDYMANGQRIQVIHVSKKATSLYDYILERYDFDVCKVAYGIDRQGKDYVKVYALDEVIAKRTRFTYHNRLGESVKRCLKYKARGFTFDLPDGILEKVRQTCRQGRSIYDQLYGGWEKEAETESDLSHLDDEWIDVVDVEMVEAQDEGQLTLRCDPGDAMFFEGIRWDSFDNHVMFDDDGSGRIHINPVAVKKCKKTCPVRMVAPARGHLHVNGAKSNSWTTTCRDLILLFGPQVTADKIPAPKTERAKETRQRWSRGPSTTTSVYEN